MAKGERYRYTMDCPKCGDNIHYYEVVDPGHYTGPWENCYPAEVVDEWAEPCANCGYVPTDDDCFKMQDGEREKVTPELEGEW